MLLNPITHGHIAWTVDDIEEVKRKLDERGVYYADCSNYLMSTCIRSTRRTQRGTWWRSTNIWTDRTNTPALAGAPVAPRWRPRSAVPAAQHPP